MLNNSLSWLVNRVGKENLGSGEYSLQMTETWINRFGLAGNDYTFA